MAGPTTHHKDRGVRNRSLIQICITPSLESTPWFIPSASPVTSRLTSSFTCQLISIIITTLIIHHSFTLSLQAQNLPFQQILPTLIRILLLPWTAFTITGPDRTYHVVHLFLVRFFSLIFLFVACGGLSWLHTARSIHCIVYYRIATRKTES